MNSSKQDNRLPHSSNQINELINSFTSKPAGKLIILAGKNVGEKKNLIQKIKKSSANVKEIDLRDVISTVEEETYENLDNLFDVFKNNQIVYLMNGDVLSGEYTGNTYSFRRYASPQEKYLFRKLEKSSNGFILDLLDEANVNHMMERKAEAIIDFNAPKGGLSKLFWKLKQISVHGHTFENKRPLKK